MWLSGYKFGISFNRSSFSSSTMETCNMFVFIAYVPCNDALNMSMVLCFVVGLIDVPMYIGNFSLLLIACIVRSLSLINQATKKKNTTTQLPYSYPIGICYRCNEFNIKFPWSRLLSVIGNGDLYRIQNKTHSPSTIISACFDNYML